MKITKSRLKQIIKEELESVLKESFVHASGMARTMRPGGEVDIDELQNSLDNDKVLYYYVKGYADSADNNNRELTDAEFVQILDEFIDDLQGTAMSPEHYGDHSTYHYIIKKAIKNALLHPKSSTVEIYKSIGEVRTYEIAALGMMAWGEKQVELGTHEERLDRWDAGER